MCPRQASAAPWPERRVPGGFGATLLQLPCPPHPPVPWSRHTSGGLRGARGEPFTPGASSDPRRRGRCGHQGQAHCCASWLVPMPLTMLCAPQTDRALWTVQPQRKLPGQEVRRAVPTEPATLEVDAALCVCGEPRPGLRALLHPDPGCRQVRAVRWGRSQGRRGWGIWLPRCRGSRARPWRACIRGGRAPGAEGRVSLPRRCLGTEPRTWHGRVWSPDTFLLGRPAPRQHLSELPTLKNWRHCPTPFPKAHFSFFKNSKWDHLVSPISPSLPARTGWNRVGAHSVRGGHAVSTHPCYPSSHSVAPRGPEFETLQFGCGLASQRGLQ